MNQVSKWKFKTKAEAYFRSSSFKTKCSYIKVSTISICLGLAFGIIFLFCFGMNGIGFIFNSLIEPIFSPVDATKSITLFAVYVLLGLGLALGFRVKLFNMGGDRTSYWWIAD